MAKVDAQSGGKSLSDLKDTVTLPPMWRFIWADSTSEALVFHNHKADIKVHVFPLFTEPKIGLRIIADMPIEQDSKAYRDVMLLWDRL